jgi:lysophospholipase L1-like esterase
MIALVVIVFCFLGIVQSRKFPPLYSKRNATRPGNIQPRTVPLRVLPLGDSITNGVGSSDGNGYRKHFVELASQGGPLQMIGSREGKGEIMNNNNKNDGWNGYTINAIAARSSNALRAKPNLVLLLAGTNNMNNVTQASTAPAEMGALMDKV